MFTKKTIRDVAVAGKIVLVRTDYNVPLDDQAKITNDLRIEASLPTLRYLRDHGAAKIILISHLGRPDGHPDPALSLKPVADRLRTLLPEATVAFTDVTTGNKVSNAVADLPAGGIILLENLRFNPAEEENSATFAREIVADTHAQLFVQDGFAVTHRAHASTDAITRQLPSVAGFLVESEVSQLANVMTAPQHPFLIIIGGAKVADKQPLIDQFADIADHIAVTGKIAADGYTNDNPKVIVAHDFLSSVTGARLDIGEQSITQIVNLINTAKTILWNGLPGKAEEPTYAKSSIAIATAIGQAQDATSIVCGGDTTGFAENLMTQHPDLHYSLISTGGGASLELLTGRLLPGLESLLGK